MPAGEIISLINTEDKKVALAVEQALPQIAALIDAVADKLLSGGRLFYIGAGTSGRLGVLDASECPPSFGVPGELVTGIIAGGETALRNAVENAEDDVQKGWEDLTAAGITSKDIVIGIAASGTTPYVLAAIEGCRKAGISTGCITCNAGTPLAANVDLPVEVITDYEFITGSTRMKSGTAQKMVLNMISTTTMILLGRIEDNRMVDMQLTNDKLIDRGVKVLMERTAVKDYTEAKAVLIEKGSVRLAQQALLHNPDKEK